MISDEIQQQLEKIGKDTADADRQLYIQRNKLMKPIYAKRREILKKVPNFWGTAVSKLYLATLPEHRGSLDFEEGHPYFTGDTCVSYKAKKLLLLT
jgi:hypothetical protein